MTYVLKDGWIREALIIKYRIILETFWNGGPPTPLLKRIPKWSGIYFLGLQICSVEKYYASTQAGPASLVAGAVFGFACCLVSFPSSILKILLKSTCMNSGRDCRCMELMHSSSFGAGGLVSWPKGREGLQRLLPIICQPIESSTCLPQWNIRRLRRHFIIIQEQSPWLILGTILRDFLLWLGRIVTREAFPWKKKRNFMK